jgi:hypothetical protein
MSPLHENVALARTICSLPLPLPAVVPHLKLCPLHTSLHVTPFPPLCLCALVQPMSRLLFEDLFSPRGLCLT